MTLTVEAIGLYDVPVISSDSLQALDISLSPEDLKWLEGPERASESVEERAGAVAR
jgi:hypothetical protein